MLTKVMLEFFHLGNWKVIQSCSPVLRYCKSAALFTGPVLTCYPPTTCNNAAKATFTDSFCWGSSSAINRRMCSEEFPFNETTLLEKHENINLFYAWFHYILISQVR